MRCSTIDLRAALANAGLEAVIAGESRVPLPLVVIGDQAVRLRVGRLLAEDLLGPPHGLFGMAVFEEPAGGVVLELHVAGGGVQGGEEPGEFFLIATEPGADLLFGPGLVLPPESTEDDA